jgi:hypothetical protein
MLGASLAGAHESIGQAVAAAIPPIDVALSIWVLIWELIY